MSFIIFEVDVAPCAAKITVAHVRTKAHSYMDKGDFDFQ